MKKRAAFVSILSNSALIIIKIIAGVVSGSVSIISEAMHSAIDLVASIIAYFSIKQADKPADHIHPFGHGKYENLSAFAESVLIILVAILIIYEAVHRMFIGKLITDTTLALAVMATSTVVNFFVSRYLFKVAKITDSMALEADGKHLSTDVYSSLGVFIGIAIVALTGFKILDSITAILIACFIMYEGVILTKNSISNLLDAALPEDEVKQIKEVLTLHGDSVKNYHELRTRKSGSQRHIDLHMTVCRSQTIATIHQTMDAIESSLSEKLPNSNIMIHPEPCIHQSDTCKNECPWDNPDLKHHILKESCND